MRRNYRGVLAGLIASTALVFSGCGDSENYVYTNNPAPVVVPKPPVAVNDAFNALGNATVTQSAANGVLTNDTLNGATISAFDAVGNQGGAIVLNNDGGFTYTPVFGFVGVEKFTYTLTNADGDSTATVTMTSTGRGVFVRNTAPDGGNGSQATPFDTLAEAIAASAAGDTVVVMRGDGTSSGLSGSQTLPAGVDLVGEGTGLVLAQTVVPPGQPPVLQGPIVCGGDNTIKGIELRGSATDSIVIDGVGDVTIDQVTSTGPAEEHVDINDASGTVAISNCHFGDIENAVVGDYVNIRQNGLGASFAITGNSFTNTPGHPEHRAVRFDSLGNGTDFTMTFSDNTVKGVDAASEFRSALEVSAQQNGGAFFLTADGNVIQFTDEETIEVRGGQPNVTMTGSITNNMISDVSDEQIISVNGNNGTYVISGNILTNGSDEAIQVWAGVLGATFIIENNEISNINDYGITVLGEDGDVTLAVRNNTITDTTYGSIYVYLGSSANLCAVITGNIVSNDMELQNQTTGDFNVEQFGNATGDLLKTLNTFNGGATVTVPNGSVNSVPAGSCGI